MGNNYCNLLTLNMLDLNNNAKQINIFLIPLPQHPTQNWAGQVMQIVSDGSGFLSVLRSDKGDSFMSQKKKRPKSF